MINYSLRSDTVPLRIAISQAYLIDETRLVQSLIVQAELNDTESSAIADRARQLIIKTREQAQVSSGIEALLREFDLSSDEGVTLLRLAEALLRLHAPSTTDQLLKDKLNHAVWQKHLGQSHSFFVNVSTMGSILCGNLICFDEK